MVEGCKFEGLLLDLIGSLLSHASDRGNVVRWNDDGVSLPFEFPSARLILFLNSHTDGS